MNYQTSVQFQLKGVLKCFSLWFIITLMIPQVMHAQSCLTEGITFTTQSQIDSFPINFPSCHVIEGSIAIQGDSIFNLDSLSCLTGIGGSLSIENNLCLSSLNGLENITYIGDGLYIGLDEGNPSLKSIQGLSGIDSIGSNLTIINNDALKSLSGLEGISNVSGLLQIQYNDSLPNLIGLDNISYIDWMLEIEGNNLLLNLAGLGSLASIGDRLVIRNNPTLFTLTGLGMLILVGESIKIEENDALVELRGLESLQYVVQDFRIYHNPSLISFHNIDQLDSVGGEMAVLDNQSLTILVGLEGLTSVYGLWIEANALINLEGIQNLNKIDGFMTICEDSITDLNELNNLTELPSTAICGASLTSLSGLENVTYIALLQIIHTKNLQSMSGLDNLTTVGGSLSFQNNEGLIDFTGLENLTFVGELEIENNSITSLNGLNNLTTLGANLGELRINNNPYLENVYALNSLSSIDYYFEVYNNPNLSSLSGLDNIDPESFTKLSIYNNELLSTCEVQSICDFLASSNGIVDIHDNNNGCNSQEEVEAACMIGVSEFSQEKNILIYPNPFTSSITIEYELKKISNIQFTVYNVMGESIYHTEFNSMPQGSHKFTWSPSHMPCGLYYAVIRIGEDVVFEKLIKQ